MNSFMSKVIIIMNYCITIFLLFYQINSFTTVHGDPHGTILWGPGLEPLKITMGARYFFVQLVDENGKNMTESPKEAFFYVEIKGVKNDLDQPCRIWTQILDCKDGSYIVRYRLYETCYTLSITVKQTDNKVTPLVLFRQGPVLEDECNCPIYSVSAWLNWNHCASEYPQILEDLKYFPKIDFDKIRDEIIKEYDKPHSISLCHYVIKDNEIYRKCYGQHVGFKTFSDSILLYLARKMNLPDLEFFMNLGDWPLVPKNKNLYPIFSWCGSDKTLDIILPSYDITQSSIENMRTVMLDMLSVQGKIKTPWRNKIEKVFWRGRDSRRERLDLIDIARKDPDLFNASITNFFFFKDEIEKYGPGEKHVSFFDFFDYKYQLNIDGSVAAYRFPYLLAGDSVVFKQDSGYYEHFYRNAVPDVHYISIKSDLSDLVEKVKWAKEHDDEVLKIARAGRALMREIAMPRDIFCYHVSLFQEWSKRLQSQVRVFEGMEKVSQSEHACDCLQAVKEEARYRSRMPSKDEL